MKEHLNYIIDSLSKISEQNINYDTNNITLLNEILTRFVNKIDIDGGLDQTDLDDYETANDIIYNLNLENNQIPFTDLISTEYYAFGFEFQELLKHKI